MSKRERNARARDIFGAGAEVKDEDGWHVLYVPNREPLRIGRNDSEAHNALNLAEAAGWHALKDGIRIANPSWRAQAKGGDDA